MICSCGKKFPQYSEPSFRTLRDLFKGIKYILRGTPYPLLPDHLENEEVDYSLIKDVGLVYEEVMKEYEVSGFEQQTFKAARLIDTAKCMASPDNVPILSLPTAASWKQA
ncbi:hypothetical protein TKK_0003875 [Trichogramma kaykai]|uniref:Uncharacterized protein n=1 Tax=Trichogramma kaykai TaxID=54128 RepID=A0ABD2XNG1_9HYME